MPYMEKKNIMSHFFPFLCGLGSVLTEVGVISKSYLSAVLLGREKTASSRERQIRIHSCREQQVFVRAGVEISIIILGVIIS